MDMMLVRQSVVANFQTGLIYMVCVISILLAHEMGHFVATVLYRVPASLPYFIPFPMAPIGTMGAVIGMDGQRANRKEIFDIGLAGPIAGLVVALPILWVGVSRLHLEGPGHGAYAYDSPLLVRWMIAHLHPARTGVRFLSTSQVNPYFMAGWVGLLITGLNMLPVSQLDGGHVVYTLFGKRAHWIARMFVLAAVAYVVLAKAYIWLLMVVLVVLIGTDHPPTANDHVRLGWLRTILGLASLLIPVFCFPLRGLVPAQG
jgi:membrane-associated protease RseP (regulator of RpoE activity)